jgi:hypothetical protein
VIFRGALRAPRLIIQCISAGETVYVSGGTEGCSTLVLWPDWTMFWWGKGLAEICALGAVLGAISVSGDAKTGRKDRPKDRRNIVERCLDGFHALGTVRFH